MQIPSSKDQPRNIVYCVLRNMVAAENLWNASTYTDLICFFSCYRCLMGTHIDFKKKLQLKAKVYLYHRNIVTQKSDLLA